MPSALVTMSWRSLADAVVGALPDGTFAAVVTGDEVDHGKPHPEPYRGRARGCSVSTPANCVAIEDSPDRGALGRRGRRADHRGAARRRRGVMPARCTSTRSSASRRALVTGLAKQAAALSRRREPPHLSGRVEGDRVGALGQRRGVPPHAGHRSWKSHQSHSLEVRGPPVTGALGRTTASQTARTLRSSASRSCSSGRSGRSRRAEVDQLELPGPRRGCATGRGRRTSSGTAPWPRTPRSASGRSCSRRRASRRRARRRAGRRSPRRVRPVDLGLDVELARGGLEPRGVLEGEPALDQRPGTGEPALLVELLVVLDHRRELGRSSTRARQARLEQGEGGLWACARRRAGRRGARGPRGRGCRGPRRGRAGPRAGRSSGTGTAAGTA